MPNQKISSKNMIFNNGVVRRMLSVDAKQLELKDTKDFIAANFSTVSLAVNLQDRLVADIIGDGALHERASDVLLSLYLEFGFIGTQKLMSDFLTDLLSEVEDGQIPYETNLMITPGRMNEFVHLISVGADQSSFGSLKAICQILGFLARFTLIEDVSGEASIVKFCSVNTACSKWDRSQRFNVIQRDSTHMNYGRRSSESLGVSQAYPSEFILDGISYELAYILGRVPSLDEDFALSSGSVADGCRSVGSKVDLWAQMFPHFEMNLLDSTSTGIPCEYKMGERYPVLCCVPKSLGARRVIAPEPLAKAVLGQASLKALRRALQKTGAMHYINDKSRSDFIDGQDINRALACAGSHCESWSTADLSSASDSISRTIFFRVCPLSWRPFFARNLSWYIRTSKGSSAIPLHTLFTSGHPLCWDTEAAYFLAIARFCARLSRVKQYRSKCYCYGDDIIVPDEAYEALCSVLELLGHKVNRNKSYTYGFFRESCGGWYYWGEDITPIFWPRSEVAVEGLGLQSLCQLQHQLVGAGYDLAQTYLTQVIKEKMPEMTYSPVNEECDDLWSDEVTFSTSERLPHYTIKPKWRVHRSVPMEHFLYYRYLKYGPSYDSKLDELLGVSSSRRRTSYLTDESRWVKAAPLYGVYAKAEK